MSDIPYEKINIKGISRTEWLKLRKMGIGGSDASVIAGVNVNKDGEQYKTVAELIEEKLSPEVDETSTLACRHGTHCEPFVAELFTEVTGLKVQKSNFMYRSKEHPFMLANIDRKIIGQNAGLECKTASVYYRNNYEDSCIVPANDDSDYPFPASYYKQVTHYMAVTGWDRWYVAVLIGSRDFRWYEVERDERHINDLIKKEMIFNETLNKERKIRSV